MSTSEKMLLDACLSLDTLIDSLLEIKAKAAALDVHDLKVCAITSAPDGFTTLDVTVIYPPLILEMAPTGAFVALVVRRMPAVEPWTPFVAHA